jgi:hypothetical protein
MCLNIVWFGGLCLVIAWSVFVWGIGLTGTSLFILGAATGLVFAPIFPLSFGMFNQRLNVIPMLIALLLCGSALGAIIFQKIAGKRIFDIFKKRFFFSFLRFCNGSKSKSVSSTFNYLHNDVYYTLWNFTSYLFFTSTKSVVKCTSINKKWCSTCT